MTEESAEKNLPWLVLRAANRTQAKGSTVRLIVPRAQEVAEELGMELTDSQLHSVEEHLRKHGYIEPANIGLTWGTYTITPAGLRWLEEAPPSEPPEPPTETPESGEEEEPGRESLQTPVERPEGEEVWLDAASPLEGSERPWWRRVFGA